MKAARAGALYFVAVFACGFLLGVLRELVLRHRLGELNAVLVEIPVMLAISWVIARRIVERLDVPSAIADRLAMGGVALAMLLAAEAALAILGLGRSPWEHVASYATPRGVVTIASQAIFGLIPLLLLRWTRPS